MSQVDVTRYPDRGGTSPPPFLAGEIPSLSPISMMRRFTEEMDHLFGPPGYANHEQENELWAPVIEVNERDGRLMISADLPGVKKEDIKVEVTKDTVILQGERKQAQREKHEGNYRSERTYGRFYRTISLPEGANADQASAEITNGTLEITIPMSSPQSLRRQIPVRESQSRAEPPKQAQ